MSRVVGIDLTLHLAARWNGSQSYTGWIGKLLVVVHKSVRVFPNVSSRRGEAGLADAVPR